MAEGVIIFIVQVKEFRVILAGFHHAEKEEKIFKSFAFRLES